MTLTYKLDPYRRIQSVHSDSATHTHDRLTALHGHKVIEKSLVCSNRYKSKLFKNEFILH